MVFRFEDFLIFLVLSFFVAFCIVFVWKTPKNRPRRTGFLRNLIILNSALFSIGLVLLVLVLPQSLLNIVSWVVFDFLASYVFCIEIPAYLKISKFDQSTTEALRDLRKELIKMRYSFTDSLENLR